MNNLKTAQMSLSDSAVKQISKLVAASSSKNAALRVSVSGGGCSGFQYHFDFDEEQNKDDLAIKSENKTLAVIDETSYELLKDSQIVFADELGGSYFKIENPNANSTCGCGSSFSV
jgi:iron-sulfur cluster insertion protein